MFGEALDGGEALDASAVSGDAELRVHGSYLRGALAGAEQIYRIQVSLGRPFSGNGLCVRIRVSGWTRLSSVLVGYTNPQDMRRITLGNLRQDHWVDVAFCQDDLSFLIRNAWQRPGQAEISELHLHFTGLPSNQGASFELERIELWDAVENDFPMRSSLGKTSFAAALATSQLSRTLPTPDPGLLDEVCHQLERQYPSGIEQAKAFMATGVAPSYLTTLDWPLAASVPPGLALINSYRWSWHALHPVMMLLVYARQSQDTAAVFAARDLTTAWLDRSYYTIDPDQKYAWYDHGVADRVIALLLLWEFAIQLRFDQRFVARLLEALFRHCQLLASEMFYAFHQPMRHHNHAVFQDLALLSAAAAMPLFCASPYWVEIASTRLLDQVEQLLVPTGDYRICVENSLGYHVGLQYLVEYADKLLARTGHGFVLSALVQGMGKFSEATRYVDGRRPAIGDTAREPNPTQAAEAPLTPYAAPELLAFEKAGYVLVKGNHDQRPFMLTVSATSRTETHKHQDNLSFSLFFDGVEWLIDPSFFCYEPSQSVARYLRSAAAHNAFIVPDKPYSITPGIAQLDANISDQRFVIAGRHAAYRDIEVTREIRGRLDVLGLCFLEGMVCGMPTPLEQASLMLHCGDGVSCAVQDASITLSHPASDFVLALHLPSSEIRTSHGQLDDTPVRGVTGLAFMRSTAITSVECVVRSPAEARWELVANRQSGTSKLGSA